MASYPAFFQPTGDPVYLIVARPAYKGGGASPPTILSQTLLADGVTIRCVPSVPLTAGDAVGLTRSVGTITSASVVGGNLDIVIPKAYAGDSIGTLTYDGTGTLAGATGAVAAFGPVAITNNGPAWTPAELPGIIDYMIWSDLTRLFQNSDGTGAVASVDDPIGYMRGQLDVLTYTQTTASTKPKLGVNGIDFSGYGSARHLEKTGLVLPASYPTLTAGFWKAVVSGATNQHMIPQLYVSGAVFACMTNAAGYDCYVRRTTVSNIVTTPYAAGSFIQTTDGTAAVLYKDGVNIGSPVVGTGTNNYNYSSIGLSTSSGATPALGTAWIVCHGAGAHVDAATAIKIHNWLANQ